MLRIGKAVVVIVSVGTVKGKKKHSCKQTPVISLILRNGDEACYFLECFWKKVLEIFSNVILGILFEEKKN